MDDLAERLDLIIALVEGARAMPLSASCVLNRAEMLEALEDLRARLPERLADADRILADSESIIDDAHRQASAIVADGRREGARLASGSAVVVQAQSDAASIMAAARRESEDMRSQIDAYVDGKLAGFEELLDRTLISVTRGRERLASRAAMASAASAAGARGMVGSADPSGAEMGVGGARAGGAGPAGGWAGGDQHVMVPRQGESGGYGPAGYGPAGELEEPARADAADFDADGPRGGVGLAGAPGRAATAPEAELSQRGEQWGGMPAARGGMTGHVRLTSGAGAPIG
ncbi:hypothetical protein [Parafrankia sp. FMc2]|uniref:hypothetical protein n=1 Tax=Parafrankia sp. FMc2 TaxID=3233196 RepID=UPI0034D454D2